MDPKYCLTVTKGIERKVFNYNFDQKQADQDNNGAVSGMLEKYISAYEENLTDTVEPKIRRRNYHLMNKYQSRIDEKLGDSIIFGGNYFALDRETLDQVGRYSEIREELEISPIGPEDRYGIVDKTVDGIGMIFGYMGSVGKRALQFVFTNSKIQEWAELNNEVIKERESKFLK